MPHVARLFWILLLACLSPLALGERLRLVTDDWAPYVYQQDGQPRGIDYEVTTQCSNALASRWNGSSCPEALPGNDRAGPGRWHHGYLPKPSRASPTGVCPRAHVGGRVRPVPARARRHAVTALDDLAGLTVGTSPGYAYGATFNEAAHFRREAAPTHEANFGKLMLGRIDWQSPTAGSAITCCGIWACNSKSRSCRW